MDYSSIYSMYSEAVDSAKLNFFILVLQTFKEHPFIALLYLPLLTKPLKLIQGLLDYFF